MRRAARELGLFLSLVVAAPTVEARTYNGCPLPDDLHVVSRAWLERFDHNAILMTVFIQGFTFPNSSYLDLAFCIAANSGRAQDARWERLRLEPHRHGGPLAQGFGD